MNNSWVFLDNIIINFLEEEIERRSLPFFKSWKIESKKVKINGFRIDLLLKRKSKKMLCKIKSCINAINGITFFPDKSNLREIEDLKVLLKEKKRGNLSAIIFVALREDVKDFAPNSIVDINYSKILYKGILEGIHIFLIVTSFNPDELSLKVILYKKLNLLEILKNEYHLWRYPEVFISKLERINREIYIEMIGTTCYHCSFEENLFDFLEFAKERELDFKIREIKSEPGGLSAKLRLKYG
ncbi:MAG: DNA/RNA nuclease SfsA [Candidatus Hydrothermales bacterium]